MDILPFVCLLPIELHMIVTTVMNEEGPRVGRHVGVVVCQDCSQCSELLPTHCFYDKFLIACKAEKLTGFAIGGEYLETRFEGREVFARAEPVEITKGGECGAVAFAKEEGGPGADQEVGRRVGAGDGVI